jgi:hypothetical protein
LPRADIAPLQYRSPLEIEGFSEAIYEYWRKDYSKYDSGNVRLFGISLKGITGAYADLSSKTITWKLVGFTKVDKLADPTVLLQSAKDAMDALATPTFGWGCSYIKAIEKLNPSSPTDTFNPSAVL